MCLFIYKTDTKKMMMKLKDLQAKQQKQEEKSKQSAYDPMPSSILHPQQNQKLSKMSLNSSSAFNSKSLVQTAQQPPNISMISDIVPENLYDLTSNAKNNDGQNSNTKLKQKKV